MKHLEPNNPERGLGSVERSALGRVARLGRVAQRGLAALLAVSTLVIASSHTLSPRSFAALTALLAIGGVAAVALDELDAWLLSRSSLQRALELGYWLGALAPGVAGAYLYATHRDQLPGWTLPCLGLLPLLVVGWAKLRRRTPSAAPIWSAALLGLLAWVHQNEGTLASVRPGTAPLHVGLYVALWGGTWVLLELSATRLRERLPIWVAFLALVAGLCLHEADRRLLGGLYAGVHAWLGVASFSLLYGGYVVALNAVARDARWFAPVPYGGAALLIASAAATPLAIDLSFGSRTVLGRTPLGATLLPFLPSIKGPVASADHAALRYAQYLDEGPRRDWNILLVTVDALRADAIELAPNLRGLADQSLHFTRAYAPGSRTSIGMSALMSGQYSASMRWELWPYVKGKIYDPAKTSPEQLAQLGDGAIYTTMPLVRPGAMLAERLRAAGYKTLAVPYAANNHFFQRGAGFDRGIDAFEDLTSTKWRRSTSQRITNKASELLERHATRPWFLWVHYYDPHEARRSRTRYERLVRAFDKAFEKLLDRLARQGWLEDTIIAVTGDHGEALGEHGQYGHATSLYDEQVLVPLVLRVPGIDPLELDVPVSTVDLTATLLALSRAETSQLDGVNLAVADRNLATLRERPVFTELHRYFSNKGKRTADLRAVVRGDRKLILDRLKGTAELYDLKRDPKELRDLVDEEPERMAELHAILASFLKNETTQGTLP